MTHIVQYRLGSDLFKGQFALLIKNKMTFTRLVLRDDRTLSTNTAGFNSLKDFLSSDRAQQFSITFIY